MFSLLLIFGGIIGFFCSIACFGVALAMASGLWLNIGAAVLGLSIGQFAGFLLIYEKSPSEFQ